MKENDIIEGVELGSLDLYLDFEGVKEDKIHIKVFEIIDKDTLPLKDVNCSIAEYSKKRLKFIRKKFLTQSNNQGMIILEKDLDTDFLCIDFPGYNVKVVNYKDFSACLNP